MGDWTPISLIPRVQVVEEVYPRAVKILKSHRAIRSRRRLQWVDEGGQLR